MITSSQAGRRTSLHRLDSSAHRARGLIARAWLHFALRGITDAARTTAGLIAARRRRKRLHDLLQRDDRSLAEIGLTRGEIEFARDNKQ